MRDKRQAGNRAEAQALAYLQRRGLIVLEKNYRCKQGEIDLVMQDGGALVFVEVRQRAEHDAAALSIDGGKQRRLRRAAAHYLRRALPPPDCRFDAVLVDGQGQVLWLQNAFDGGIY